MAILNDGWNSIGLTQKELKLIIKGLETLNSYHYDNKQHHVDLTNLLKKIIEFSKHKKLKEMRKNLRKQQNEKTS
ncbi:MAG: hypothetical protein RBR10_12815 [Bacteroidales bacterium]|jgi:hypothetical protein|nr:hypothetical protein [Bacteroidales bacterium]MDY0370714.1 hypothetical protein [Bacteroidales bacterium]